MVTESRMSLAWWLPRAALPLLALALWGAPPAPVVPASGTVLYKSYCASCHDADGGGNGPVAQALLMRPSDLTRLSIRNKGRFPVDRVVRMLGGVEEITAHGGRHMPVWGPSFRETIPNEERRAERVKHLVEFLESIQEKPPK